MKFFSCLTLLSICFASCTNQKTATGFVIDGTVTGQDTGLVYLTEFAINGARDSAVIKDGKFHFEGSVVGASPYIISLEKNFVNKPLLNFFLENGDIKIDIDKDRMNEGKVSGSPSNDDFVAYTARVKSFDDELKRVYESSEAYRRDTTQKERMDSISKVIQGIQGEKKKVTKEFIASHPSSAVSVWLTYRNFMFGEELSSLENMYASFDTALLNTGYAKELQDHIKKAKLTAVGQPALDFTQNDTLGNPVSLKDFRGKYVLLDFWASWCVPCRMENPNLVAAFNKYKNKNFTVLSVSLDREEQKQRWLDAIKKDGLTWTHVSDLKFWDNAAAKLYGVRAVPSNYLIDPEGKIVGVNLMGEELHERLGEVL